MLEHPQLYINGRWRKPVRGSLGEVRNPATGDVAGRVALGGPADVNRAVSAAKRAFETFSRTTLEERVDLLYRIADEYRRRADYLAEAITTELGCPAAHALGSHVRTGLAEFTAAADALRKYPFSEQGNLGEVRHDPVGVACLLTPWTLPASQPAGKVASALAAGCTVVLKPARLAALSGAVLAGIIHAADVPPGVFNLVNGDSSEIGPTIAGHPDIATIALTGCADTIASVTTATAATGKRVTAELGGTSPHIVLPDADLEAAADLSMTGMAGAGGQTCSTPRRVIVPRARLGDLLDALVPRVRALRLGDPREPGVTMGPLVSAGHYRSVQRHIELGLEAGARLIAGGPGKAPGLETGHFARPTILSRVTSDMAVARDEVLGPVLSVLAYDSVGQAVTLANAAPAGPAAYVTGQDVAAARRVAEQVRAGHVIVNATAGWTPPCGDLTPYLDTRVIVSA